MARQKMIDLKYIRGYDSSKKAPPPSSGVQSVTGAGVDNTDPRNPVITNSGGNVSSVNGQTGVVVIDKTSVGLGNVDNTSDVNKPVSTAQQTALDALIPPGYIDGLKMVWVSGTALTVTTGSAYIPSLGKVLRATSDIAKTGLSLTASTWYHAYLFSNAGTPDIELSTTAPAAPYNGTARTKTGDTSRRYVGSVLTDSSSNLYYIVPNERWGWSDFYATSNPSVQQSIAQGAFVIIQYPVVNRDVASEWDTSTSTFNTAKTGTYLLTAFVHAQRLNDGANYVASVFINGTEAYRLSEQLPRAPSNTGGGSVGSSCVAALKAGDAVTFRIYCGGSQVGAFIDSYPQFTYCSVYRLQ